MGNTLGSYSDVEEYGVKCFSCVRYPVNLHVFLQSVSPPRMLDHSGGSSLVPQVQKSSAEEGQVARHHLHTDTFHVI